jgi:5'(3')-deoxyribonucleotidase
MVKIAIDLDNVLVDHVPLYKKVYKALGYKDKDCLPTSWGMENFSGDARVEMYRQFCKIPPEQMVKLNPYPGVQKYLIKLKKAGYWIEIVTCRVRHSANLRYILKLFPMVDWVEIVGLGQDKVEYLNGHSFDFWIDDYPQDAEEFLGFTYLISNASTLYNWHLRESFFWHEKINDIPVIRFSE